MRRPVFVVIIGLWLAMLGLLAQRTWRSTPAESESVLPHEATVGEEWMGVYYKDQKIGYTRHILSAADGGFTFSEESLLRLTVMNAPQTVRMRIWGRTDAAYALREVSFDLSSGVGTLHASGVVDGTTLHLSLRTGKDTTEQTLPLSEPIYLPSTLRSAIGTGGLHAGKQLVAVVFDPATLTNERMHVTVEREEPVPRSNRPEAAWRVHEEYHGVETTAWIDANGAVLREEGPMGFVLLRESATQAVHEGWSTTEAALDLVASAAVPVTQPIDDPRGRRTLRVRLSGINVDDVPSDDEQKRQDAVLTIVRPDVARLVSYALPYRDGLYAELAATPFLQSDHPRLIALAREILDGESDARRAAVRLNDWVYAHLRKVPTISIPNALQVLDLGEGDCNEHAVLLAALGRAAGLPTRVAAGAVYLDGAFFYHAWCEVWLGRWVSIDPALHQFPADATHIKFVSGDLDQQMAMMGIIGRLGIEVLADEDAHSG